MKRLLLVVGVLIAGFLGGLYSLSSVRATRNSAGTNTLPTGNPVTTGTTISSTWANNTLGDISTELTNSLDRYGRGGMLASLKGVNGTETAPTFSWTNDTTSGLYRRASGDIGFSVGGVERFGVSSDGLYLRDPSTSYGIFLSAPSLSDNPHFTFPSTTPASTLPISMNSSGAMSTAQIATAQIANSAVTTDKIANSNVTTAKIADANVTRAKLESVGYQVSSSCGLWNPAVDNTWHDVTNLSVTITTTGRPVRIELISDYSGNGSSFQVSSALAFIRVLRGSDEIAQQTMYSNSDSIDIPSSSFAQTDVITGAGTYTYKIQTKVGSGTFFHLNYARLLVYEL